MTACVREARDAATASIAIIVAGEPGSGRTLLAREIHSTAQYHGGLAVIDGAGIHHDDQADARASRALLRAIEYSRYGTLVFRGQPGNSLLQRLRDENHGSTRFVFVVEPGEVARRTEQRVAARLFSYPADDQVAVVNVPPLRKRLADLARLCAGFTEARISPVTFAALEGYAWPGNVAELRQVLDRAALSARGDGTIRISDLPPSIQPPSVTKTPPRRRATALQRTLAQVEEDYIQRVLEDCDGNQVQAAQRLGLHRNTLRRKLKQYRGGPASGRRQRPGTAS
ncbi:MAG: hypothetical protein JKY37_02380 [Nannocystaceae bacterium]|nr:hypothetical protein [Nannocystaceae bacterium]